MNWNPPEQEGELVGQITDTKSSLLRVFRLEDGATLLRADQPYPEHYEDPTPHMTAAMALPSPLASKVCPKQLLPLLSGGASGGSKTSVRR